MNMKLAPGEVAELARRRPRMLQVQLHRAFYMVAIAGGLWLAAVVAAKIARIF